MNINKVRTLSPEHLLRKKTTGRAWAPDGGSFSERLVVRPIAGGWCVQCDPFESTVFRKGAQAEVAARRIAESYTRLGRDATISLYDARNVLVGAIQYYKH